MSLLFMFTPALTFFVIQKQWMANGVAGPCGQHAQNHVVQASKREAALAQIHLHAMEEANAVVKLNRRRVVTLSLVQVYNNDEEF